MLTGSCLCGAIAYEADAPLTRIVHCHCQTCPAPTPVPGRRAGGPALRPLLPAKHRDFFGLLPSLSPARVDARGGRVPSLVRGRAGFAPPPAPLRLCADALPRADDPAVAG